MHNTVKAIIISTIIFIAPTVLLAVAGWLWLAPSDAEIRMGTAEPPLASESREYMRNHAVGSIINSQERAKSMDWVSKPWVVATEKHIKEIAEPIIYSVDYVMGRMIEYKFGVKKGFPRTLLLLAVGIPIVIVLFVAGAMFIGPHMTLSGSGLGYPVFMLSTASGILVGMADLFQLGMEWYLLPAIAFIAGAALLFLAAGLTVIDAFKAKLWTVFVVVAIGYGFVLGIVISSVLTILTIFGLIAIFSSGILCGGFQVLSDSANTSTCGTNDHYQSEGQSVSYDDNVPEEPITVYKDENGVEYHGKGNNPDTIERQSPGDHTTFHKSPLDGKYRSNWSDEVIEKKSIWD